MFKHSLIALAAIGAGLAGFSTTQASAFTAAPQTSVMDHGGSPLLVDVRHRNNHDNWDGNWNRNRHGDRCNSWSRHCRHYHRGYYYQNPWWVLPMIGAGIVIGGRSTYDDGGGYGSRHVEWCMDRYRSYNVRNNTWVSYSGRVNQCVSPYGP